MVCIEDAVTRDLLVPVKVLVLELLPGSFLTCLVLARDDVSITGGEWFCR